METIVRQSALGFTCRILYLVLKTLYPRKIHLYRERFGLNELKLRERYEDYDLMSFEYGGVRYRLLQNPYNMGYDWYEEKYRKLRETEFPGWSPPVREFWNNRVEIHLHMRR